MTQERKHEVKVISYKESQMTQERKLELAQDIADALPDPDYIPSVHELWDALDGDVTEEELKELEGPDGNGHTALFDEIVDLADEVCTAE